MQGPNDNVKMFETFVLTYDHEQVLAENERLRELLRRLLEEESLHDRGDGNAPGHCHQAPGVWDSDNGEKAGKPCAWCALWAEAKATILTPNSNSIAVSVR